jgi:hypothetical protein
MSIRISILIGLILLFTSRDINGQSEKPVRWEFTMPEHYSLGDTIEVSIWGVMNNDWLMHATQNDSTAYIRPAKITTHPNTTFELLTPFTSQNSIRELNELLNQNIWVHKDTARFTSIVRVTSLPIAIECTVEYVAVKGHLDEFFIYPGEELVNIK